MHDSLDKEWRRLTGHYAGMYDEELLDLARDYKSLTEMAQQVLRDEMKKRGLGEPLAPRPRVQAKPASGQVSEAANRRAPAFRSVESAPVDPRAEQDRRRFAEHYSSLCDQDLVRLSSDLGSLTAGAQLALRDEWKKRRLDAPDALTADQDAATPDALARAEARLAAQRNDDAAEPEDEAAGEYTWKTALCEFDTRAEALQRMEMLRRAGIESWFRDPSAYFAEPQLEMLGFRIMVAADQLEEAQRIVAQPVPADIVEQSQTRTPEFEMPRCPRCRAADPVLIDTEPSNKWLCEGCGHEWTEPCGADAES